MQPAKPVPPVIITRIAGSSASRAGRAREPAAEVSSSDRCGQRGPTPHDRADRKRDRSCSQQHTIETESR